MMLYESAPSVGTAKFIFLNGSSGTPSRTVDKNPGIDTLENGDASLLVSMRGGSHKISILQAR